MPSLTVRLRPTRLCFLVEPNSAASFRLAVDTATSLWGGNHSAIVPVYGRTPSWWTDRPFRPPSAIDVVRGYLSAFEPDFVVELDAQLPKGIDFPTHRVVKWPPSDLAPENEDHPPGIALLRVLADLHDREFKFVRKHPVQCVIPAARDAAMGNFVAAAFGGIPAADGSGLGEALAGALGAERVLIGPDNYGALARCFSPLRVGMWRTRMFRRHWSDEPTLMLLDGTDVRDLIDFWNLRAVGWDVLGLPTTWAADPAVQEWCGRFVAKHHGPHRLNPQLTMHTTLLKGRSIDQAAFDALRPQLSGGLREGLVAQTWYPRFASDWSRRSDHLQRCVLEAGESRIDSASAEIAIKQIDPPFDDHHGSMSWVNAVEVSEYASASEVALVLPPGTHDVGALYGRFDRQRFASGTEGLVVHCEHRRFDIHASLPDGLAVFSHWLQIRGLQGQLSGAGRTALHVIRSIGGLAGAGLLANEPLLRALNHMAHGLVEEEVREESNKHGGMPTKSGARRKHKGSTAERVKRKAQARDYRHEDFLAMLKKSLPGDADTAQRTLDALVLRKAIELGVRVACPACTQANWHRLKDLGAPLRCDRCLEAHPFPASRPPKNSWSYRVLGPFSSADFAQGAYAVALSIRFFASVLRSPATWVPSMTLTSQAGANVKGVDEALEFDFGVWIRAEGFERHEPRLVLGEAKTFVEFNRRDVKRAEKLGVALPGVVFAFCTLNEALTAKEKSLIARLAKKGRPPAGQGQWSLVVLILTRRELFSDMGPPYCWQDAHGWSRHGQWSLHHDGLERLADITQQIHLDLPSTYDSSGSGRIAPKATRRARR